ncbi:basic salivary proline-rich protein 1-like [Paramacrobiotus metropolitanus]|uniref:basic salivary proline-rich protein 1-like n=1 Tax=Paramacrobiotus metropolitanus TaxID=2943436 RepID=UPI0024459C57|nr:basic salivary proline-rich protein 1-like [Paramacrobiotus metropolitanus]
MFVLLSLTVSLAAARDLVPLSERNAALPALPEDLVLMDDEPLQTRQRPFPPPGNNNRPPMTFDNNRPLSPPPPFEPPNSRQFEQHPPQGFPVIAPNMAPPLQAQANSFPGRPPLQPAPQRPEQRPPPNGPPPVEPPSRQAMISGLMALPLEQQQSQSLPQPPPQLAQSMQGGPPMQPGGGLQMQQGGPPMAPMQPGGPPGSPQQSGMAPPMQQQNGPPPASIALDPAQQGSEVVIRPPASPSMPAAQPISAGPIPPGMMTGVASAQQNPMDPAQALPPGAPVPPQEVQAFAVPNDSQNAIPTGGGAGDSGAVDRLHDMTSGLLLTQQEMAERIHQQSEVIAFLMKSLVREQPTADPTPKSDAVNNKPSSISTGFT